MPTTQSRKQHIKVRETQMEISDEKAPFTDDFEGKLADAQTQLEVYESRPALYAHIWSCRDLLNYSVFKCFSRNFF